MNNLTIRKAGKYYQIGYYVKGSWINVEHIGTAERVLELIRSKKTQHTNPDDVLISSPESTIENLP